MAKLTKVINGEQVTIEGTIEELKQFQENGNITSDLLSPKERLDTDNKDEELKVGDIVRFTEDSDISLKPMGFAGFFYLDEKIKKGEYANLNQCIDEDEEITVQLEGIPLEISLDKVKDIVEKVGELKERNPLKLEEGKEYLIHSYDGQEYGEMMELSGIDDVSYMFESDSETQLYIPYRKTDELSFSDIVDDEDIEPVVEVEDDDDLEVGEYYNVSFIHCDYSGDTLSGKVKLKEIDEDGDYIFVDEDDTTSCIIKPENLDHYIFFDELEENEESEDNEEETEKPENNQKEFKEGNIVEVIEEVGGVKEGNYGIVMGYDFDGDVILAGYDRVGVFSDRRYHLERGLKLIKE